MATDLSIATRPRLSRSRPPLLVPVSVGVVVVLRLLTAFTSGSPDENGFLMVAGQWHAGGSSLYGNYWVDRPPLLLMIFKVADLTGGLVSLRVIGALGAAVAVAALSSTAHRIFGRRAAGVTAVAAAALLVSPLYGSTMVNGEILAVPFLALGIRAAVEAVYTEDRLLAWASGFAAGLAAMAAVLIKQNMADVAVFAAVCWLIAWRTRRISGRVLRDLILAAGAGAILAYSGVMLWAMAHGTSPAAVFDATYPFRIKAAQVISASAGDTADIRLTHLGYSALLAGGPLVIAALLVFGLRRSRAISVAWGLVAALAYASVSILSGGSYWLHYLVETIPAVALAAGAVSMVAPRLIRALAGLMVLSSVIALVAILISPAANPGDTVGRSLAASAQPGDTVISMFGDAGIPRQAEMSSPYPYLWSLPSRTLDPDMALLRGVLAGPTAPTWVVVRGSGTEQRLVESHAMAMINDRYQMVDTVCGRKIYLLDGITRTPPATNGSCHGLVLP